jgi:hypothetical protein
VTSISLALSPVEREVWLALARYRHFSGFSPMRNELMRLATIRTECLLLTALRGLTRKGYIEWLHEPSEQFRLIVWPYMTVIKHGPYARVGLEHDAQTRKAGGNE